MHEIYKTSPLLIKLQHDTLSRSLLATTVLGLCYVIGVSTLKSQRIGLVQPHESSAAVAIAAAFAAYYGSLFILHKRTRSYSSFAILLCTGLAIQATMQHLWVGTNSSVWLVLCPIFAYVFLGGKPGLLAVAACLAVSHVLWHLRPLSAGTTSTLGFIDLCAYTMLLGIAMHAFNKLYCISTTMIEQLQAEAVSETVACTASRAKSKEDQNKLLTTITTKICEPLDCISEEAEKLRELPLPENAAETVTMIRYCIDHIVSLVGNLVSPPVAGFNSPMAESRLVSLDECATMTIERKPFNVVKQVDGVLQVLRFKAKHKAILLNSDATKVRYPVHIGDAARFRQVVINLVNNAIKFTPRQGRVDVVVFNTDEDKDEIRVEVTDNGVGLSEEDQKAIFERFYRTNTSIEGSGLGLPICKKICEVLGGTIGCSSQVGIGSTFWFTMQLQAVTGDRWKREE